MGNSSIKIKKIIELNTSKIDDDKIIISSPWTITTDMNKKRCDHAGCGTSSSALSFDGNDTESFNGNIWSNKKIMNCPRYNLAGCGINNSALAFGGWENGELRISNIEEYNGDIWNNKTDMNSYRRFLAGCGINNSALAFGGWDSFAYPSNIEYYNGNTCINKSNLNTNRLYIAGCGISNNSLAFGGGDSDGNKLTITELYNGIVWTNKNDMNTSRNALAGCGDSSSALAFGGNSGINFTINSSNTEEYNGNIWINKSNMNNGRLSLAGCGNSSSALSFGGNNRLFMPLTVCEIYNGNENNIEFDITKNLNKNINIRNTKDTWIMQSNLNNPRSGLNVIGYSNAAIATGGINHNILLEKDKSKFYDYQYYTESFDSNIWSSKSNMNKKRCNHSGCGYFNNAIVTLGLEIVNESFSDSIYLVNTEIYNGIVWSSGQDCIHGSFRSSACGEKDSSLVVGSSDSISSYSGVYYLNGNAWTQCSKRNKNNYNSGISGVHNSALSYGGTELTSKNSDNNSEYYNGEIWAMTESIPVDVDNCNGSGKLSNSVLCRSKTNTCIYNGSTWKSTSYGISYLSEKSSVGNALSGLSISGLGSANTCLLQSYVEKFIGSKSNKILNAKIKIKGSPLYSYNDIKLDLNMHFSHNKIWKLKNQINNDRQCYIGIGDKDCAMICGGKVNGIISDSVEINTNQIWNTAYSKLNLAKYNSSIFGNDKSFISTAGNTADSSYTDYSEENKESYFVSIQNLPLKTYSSSGCGVVNSGINICGFSTINSTSGDDYLDKMISYNGSSWSQESNTLIKSMEQNAIGKSNSFIIIGGLNNKIARDSEYSYLRLSNHCYKFDGDSLSTVSDCNIAKSCSSSSGTLNNLINYCGETIISESFNGSIWKIENCTNNSRKLGCSYDSPLAISGCVDRKDYSTEAYEDVDDINSFLDTLTTPVIKAKKFNWESTTATNIAKYGANATGTVNSCLSFAGINTSALSNTEIFDGESWINKQGLTTCGKYYSGAVGVSNASLIYSGMKQTDLYNNLTEFFNGSAWSNKNALSKNAANVASCGTINNALNIGGFTTNGDDSFSIFDGSEWKLNTAMSESSAFNTAVGSFNSCTVIGGKRGNSNYCEKTELFNGVQWSTGKDISVGRNNHASSGTSQNTIITNGKTSETDSTAYSEKYNGVLWSFIQNSSLHKSSTSLSGNTNLSINIGGYMDDAINTCEKYKESDNDVIIDIISSSTWSIKSDMNTARYHLAGCGTSKNALSFGGHTAAAIINNTELYNGVSWINKNHLNVFRYGLGGCGTGNNALSFGGDRGGIILLYVEGFDGDKWIAKPIMNASRRFLAGCGTGNDALAYGGYDNGIKSATEVYNGSSWSITTYMSNPRYLLAGSGTIGSALAIGGNNGTALNNTEVYDGSKWVAVTGLNTPKYGLSACGSTDSTLAFGGLKGSYLAITDLYEGNSWSTLTNMNKARSDLAGCGTSSSALSFGGNDGSTLSTTEEYSGGSNDYYIPSLNEEFTLENKLEYWKVLSDSHPNPRRSFGLFGCENDAFISMGYNANTNKLTNTSEKFNGKEWFSTFDNIINKFGVGSSGITGAGLTFGGGDFSNASNTTEKYNASGISAGTTLNTARLYCSGCGINNDSLCVGGKNSSSKEIYKSVESFDGNTWHNHSNMNISSFCCGTCGNSNAAVEFGGAKENSITLDYTSIYNSNCWLIKTNMPTVKSMMGSTGSINKALSNGGDSSIDGLSSNLTGSTEEFNGETWRVCKNMIHNETYQESCGYALAVFPIGSKNSSIITERFYQQDCPEFNTNKLKIISDILEPSWVIKADMNIGSDGMAGCGVSSSALGYGGGNPAVSRNNFYNTELYNNIIWSNKTNLNNNTTGSTGCGNSNSALSIGGYSFIIEDKIPYVEEYNSIIWLNKSNINTARYASAGCGTSGSALVFGGAGKDELLSSTEDYDGTKWINKANMNTGSYALSGCGVINSALSIGGADNYNNNALSNVEEYNGNVWITKTNINTARTNLGCCGNNNSALIFGGFSRNRDIDAGRIGVSEKYNGNIWSYKNNLNIPRDTIVGCGSSSNALGYNGKSKYGITKTTEQYYPITDITLESNNITISSDYDINLKLKSVYNPNENIRVRNWHIKPNMNNARCFFAGCGNSYSTLAFGGHNNGTMITTTEKYDGSLWSNITDMNKARSDLAGCGTGDSALAFGGSYGDDIRLGVTEKYSMSDVHNSIWNSKTNMNTARCRLAGCGINSNALAFGGSDSDGITNFSTTELYDNTSWVNRSNMNTARYELAGCGTSGSALAFGGGLGAPLFNTEFCNGVSWVNRSNMNTARYKLAGCGASGSALAFGGLNSSNYLSITEEYNDNIWISKPSMNNVKGSLAGCGNSSSALSFGGWDNVNYVLSTTEEYNGTVWTNKTNMNISRYALAGCGTSRNALSFGGHNGSDYVATTELYNGSVWSNTSNMNTTRRDLAGCGTSSSALAFGGQNGGAALSITEEHLIKITYEMLWVNKADMNKARSDLAGCGTSGSALSFGGSDGSNYVATAELYNGIVWTSTLDMNTARYILAGCGVSSSALSIGGAINNGSILFGNVENYNGRIWVNISNLNIIKSGSSCCGTSVSALAFGGTNGSRFLSSTEEYNGLMWKNKVDMNNARYVSEGCGNSSNTLTFGGYDDNVIHDSTEEYN